jgi:hypothetical protein
MTWHQNQQQSHESFDNVPNFGIWQHQEEREMKFMMKSGKEIPEMLPTINFKFVILYIFQENEQDMQNKFFQLYGCEMWFHTLREH